jgi:pre-mRNA-splicing factor SYF2/beta-D-xylosidase 4
VSCLGNYNGTAPFIITLRQGIQRALQPLGGTVQYALGCNVACTNTNGFAAAVAAVNAAGVHAAVIVLGIDQSQVKRSQSE